MKAVLDHVGIAVADLAESLRFFHDGLGLEVDASEEVVSQAVRAHFLAVGESSLELLEATRPDSPIARYLSKRGPGLHHITLRVSDLAAALQHLKARGVRLIDERPRDGAEGALVAFIHPSSAHGILVELKQARHAMPPVTIARRSLGDLELISLHDGFLRLDGGAMFGVVPKPLWQKKTASDDRNRITLAMRPLVVRGVRTMLIDGGVGDKEDAKFRDIYGLERERHLDHTLAEAGLRPEDIDVVVATHLHFDHAGGFTMRDGRGRIVPRFPRARYVFRRGEWEDATHPHERNRANYQQDNLKPLADAGVVDLVDEDQTIMPGVRVRRTGGHTMHHQSVWIESNRQQAVYVGDIIPTAAHLAPAWIMGIDLYPMDTLAAKKALVEDVRAREVIVYLPHDPHLAVARVTSDERGRPQLASA
ncbi:MAG TPA: methylmalonyl-CoA epimerase [Vicinamibacterales bacterium]|nr:methylmalonyl-CoA epimerase [Vicinamibacterales bacterium]